MAEGVLPPGAQGHYYTDFKVPDVYGVYKFMVTYHRTGYTALDLSHTVRLWSPFCWISSFFPELSAVFRPHTHSW